MATGEVETATGLWYGKPATRTTCYAGDRRGEPGLMGRFERQIQNLVSLPTTRSVIPCRQYLREALGCGQGPRPNGSRLSCGRLAQRRKVKWTTVRAPPGAQHSVSIRTIRARQLQAHVRRRAFHRCSSAPRVTRSPRAPWGWEVACGQPPDGRTCAARRPRSAAVGCGARRTDPRSGASALGAPRTHRTKRNKN